MLILPLAEAQPGMVLAAPVWHPAQPEQELLKRGYVLEKTVLQRLADLGVESIFVDFPGLDDLDRHLAAQLSPARMTIYNQIRETITANQRRTAPAVSFVDYYRSTRELVLTLVSQGQHPIFLDQMSRLPGDAVGHATAVAHLSMVLGLKLERYLIEQRHRLPPNHAREVVNLGVAGMLHDMGKLRLPANLQTRYVGNEPESDDQLAEWQTHARLGYELIRDGVEPSAAIAVLHHHQHFDGSGFPRTIHEKGKPDSAPVGRQIHVFPRIVMVADLYDRLSTAPGSSQRRPNIEILHRIRECYGAWCDPTVLNMLEVVCPPYLPGSRVELSDGTKAVVVSIDPADPYKPGVRRLKRDSLELEDARIELTQPGAPQIRSVGGVSVEQFTYGRAA